MRERQAFHTYLIVSKDSQLVRVVVWDTEEIRIGRNLEQDLVLENPEISREHALLQRDGERFVVVDLDTANGTSVNGEPIQSTGLAPNDWIGIGDWSIRFCQSRENPADTLPNVTPASRLKDERGFRSAARGLAAAGSSKSSARTPTAAAKPEPIVDALPLHEFDPEIEIPAVLEKDELPPLRPPPTREHSTEGLPPDPGPFTGLEFEMDDSIPPVGRAEPKAPAVEAIDLGPRETSAPTFQNDPFDLAGPAERSMEVRLRLEGVEPELFALLQSLRGKRLDLRALSIVLKAIAVDD